MKKQITSTKKRELLASPKPKRNLNPKAKAQTINFAVIGDSHVGYGNSASILEIFCQRL